MEQERHNVNTQWKLLVWLKCTLQQLTILGENTWHFAKPPLQVFPQNNVSEKQAPKFPYLWHVTTQIWVETSHQYGISVLVYWSTGYWMPVSSCPLRGLFFSLLFCFVFSFFCFVLFALWGSVIHAIFLLKYFIYWLCLVSWPLLCITLCITGFAWSPWSQTVPLVNINEIHIQALKGGAAAPFLPPLTTSKSTQAMEGWSSTQINEVDTEPQICWCTSFKETYIHFSRSHPSVFDAPWLWL